MAGILSHWPFFLKYSSEIILKLEAIYRLLLLPTNEASKIVFISNTLCIHNR